MGTTFHLSHFARSFICLMCYVMAGLKVQIKETEPVNFTDMVPEGVKSVAKVVIGKEEFECNVLDLQHDGAHSELGRGAFGAVYRMIHKPTGTIMAVKMIRVTMDKKLRRRMEMDLRVCMDSKDCPHTITFYGALFREGDVMICMELMDMSLHDLRLLVYERLKQEIPEKVLGKMAESTLKALIYLKTKLNVLHRDVKPSNILINKYGEIKLCDFGIAGELVNSYVGTNIGCKPYLAPERINPIRMDDPYDQRSDVWSYGITISELALGKFPYPSWDTEFEMLAVVVDGAAPRLSSESGFSEDFKDFVHKCLTKNVDERPKFHLLANHPFISRTEKENVDVAGWYKDILQRAKAVDAFLPPHVVVE